MAGLKRPQPAFWAGKRVFLTGHTGFKGGWLTLWLHQLGAIVGGYALAPNTTPDLFSLCDVAAHCAHHLGDVRDAAALHAAMASFQPEIVLHLAAQPLVRVSYAAPVETFATNIMGTANLLDAARKIPTAQVILIITSDKVYAESRTARHDEASPLGGHDPYSASKACAELVTASFPMPAGQKIATVRSGNVIGGGDWAADRLVPDFFRGIFAGEALRIRNPAAVRPWQHVLDPLCGYLLAAEHLWKNPPAARASWNFGPAPASEVPVETLAAEICRLWGGGAAYRIEPPQAAPHEAPVLRLDSGKARRELGWRPGWELPQALGATVAWYRHYRDGGGMTAFTKSQIRAYEKA
ncbi:CDP-glucose 4,6-dehydratase [Acidocella aquatica]|uniref:CDP-glucose 4,6-dehydratase n=1 Tax=Acidocella aquatica TaxID=1922313 RepID=A0ABQ6A7C7_9PROT|nr:CDP-glucose 4,6-dehydratase [Acidocella aquatica]GLR68331.1 CDP-glucose 4,6-dehydratase [Acidocella aquatica]